MTYEISLRVQVEDDAEMSEVTESLHRVAVGHALAGRDANVGIIKFDFEEVARGTADEEESTDDNS